MRRIAKILLLLIALLLTSCSNKSENSSDKKNKSLSYNTVKFGKQNGKDINWIIIFEDSSHQILMSEKVLDVGLYNETNDKVSWEETTLYDYLNSDFINEYFTKEERLKLDFIDESESCLVTLPTTDNLIDLYGTIHYLKDGFYGDETFFAPNEKIIAYPSENAINNDIDPYDNETFSEYLRTDVDARYEFANGAVPYWLLNQNSNSFPQYVTSTGYIGITEADTGYIGIRPIIKIIINYGGKKND